MSVRSLVARAVQVSVSLLMFCLFISVTQRGVLNSPTITVDLSLSPFSSVSFCVLDQCSFVSCIHIWDLLCLLGESSLL